MGNGKWITPACILTFCACTVASWFSDQPGTAYLFGGLVAVLLFLAGYGRYRQKSIGDSGPPDPSHHWPTAGGTNAGETGTFRYSQGTLLFLRIIAWLSLLVVPIIYGVSRPRPVGDELIGLALFGVALFGCFYLAFLACKAYSIDVDVEGVVIHRLMKSRTYNFSSLGMVALLESGGRGSKYVLALYDKTDRALCQIDDGVDNFNQLVALIKQRAFEEGVRYRYRDMWGCWTQ